MSHIQSGRITFHVRSLAWRVSLMNMFLCFNELLWFLLNTLLTTDESERRLSICKEAVCDSGERLLIFELNSSTNALLWSWSNVLISWNYLLLLLCLLPIYRAKTVYEPWSFFERTHWTDWIWMYWLYWIRVTDYTFNQIKTFLWNARRQTKSISNAITWCIKWYASAHHFKPPC